MVRRLITRRGNDWTQRYPLVAEAVKLEFHVFKTPVGRGSCLGAFKCLFIAQVSRFLRTFSRQSLKIPKNSGSLTMGS